MLVSEESVAVLEAEVAEALGILEGLPAENDGADQDEIAAGDPPLCRAGGTYRFSGWRSRFFGAARHLSVISGKPDGFERPGPGAQRHRTGTTGRMADTGHWLSDVSRRLAGQRCTTGSLAKPSLECAAASNGSPCTARSADTSRIGIESGRIGRNAGNPGRTHRTCHRYNGRKRWRNCFRRQPAFTLPSRRSPQKRRKNR
jgi:hypothetical protein